MHNDVLVSEFGRYHCSKEKVAVYNLNGLSPVLLDGQGICVFENRGQEEYVRKLKVTEIGVLRGSGELENFQEAHPELSEGDMDRIAARRPPAELTEAILARGTARLELQETIDRGTILNEKRACRASGPKPLGLRSKEWKGVTAQSEASGSGPRPGPKSDVWRSVAEQLEADPHVTMSGARIVYNMAKVLVEEWADIRGAMERFGSDMQGLQFVLGEVEYPRALEQAKRTLQSVRRGAAARRAQLMVRLRREAGHISFGLIKQAVNDAREQMGAERVEDDEELLSEEDAAGSIYSPTLRSHPLDPEDISGFNWWENNSDEDMDNVGLAAGL